MKEQRERIVSHLKDRAEKVFARLLLYLKDIPIRKKLPGLLAIQIMIPLIFVSFAGYLIIRRTVENKAVTSAGNLLRSIQYNIEGYTDKFMQVTQDIFYENDFYDALRTSDKNDSDADYETYRQLNRILKRITLSRSDIESVYVVSNQKQYYIINDGKQEKSAVLPYEELLSAVREKKGKPIWMIRPSSSGNAVFFARAIYDKETFEELGILVLKMRMEYFSSLCGEMLSEDIHSISVIEPKGAELIHAGEQQYQLNETLLARISGGEGTVIDHKQKVLMNYLSFSEPDWTVITYTPLSVLTRESNLIRNWMIFLSLFSILLLSVISLLISYDFLRPIEKLVGAMENVDEKGKIPKIKEKRKDEFGVLIERFNRMSDRIQKLIRWGYQEKIIRKEAQIKALQAQINPHFLFNTLDSINWMAQMNGVKEISQMVTSLAYIMNASLGRGNRLITLREELVYIEHYIRILKFRFGDRIQLRALLPQEILDYPMPRLLIQPLVENSVHHGIERRKELRGGVIFLRGCRSEDEVVVEVIDNGAGMPKEQVEAMNRRLEGWQDMKNTEPERQDETGSIGLLNVSSRMKLYYGERYGLTIESREGFYTKMILRFPADGVRAESKVEKPYV